MTVLEAVINAEKRDRQTDLDQMMLKEAERHMFWLGQNMAFRHGVDCFPCAKPEGFLGTLRTKYKKSDTPWGRVHLQPHPVMAAELAYFLQDVVLYVNTQCQIESLTLGPREGRLTLDLMPALNAVPWMEYWKASPQNPS